MTTRIRAATPSDYPIFTRLAGELAVDDPVPSSEKFAVELAPRTLIAEDERGEALGYVYTTLIAEMAYVRHLVTAPAARRVGVGRALLGAVIEQARAAGAASWCLSVRPDNTAAIALYTAMGLRPTSRSRALRVAWSALDGAGEGEETIRVREPEPSEDAEAERALGLLPGQLAFGRSLPGRVLLVVEDGAAAIAGAAVFDPAFPGASPFRVTRPELGVPLLGAFRRHARRGDEFVTVTVDDDPALAKSFLARGATLRLEIIRMTAPLPKT